MNAPHARGMPATTSRTTRAGDQLSGQNEQRADPDQRGDDDADAAAVAELEKVPGGVEPVRLREPPDPRPDPEARGRASRVRPSRSTTTRSGRRGTPSPAAPTVVPAPMLAASTVENSSGAPSARPATKKSPLPRTIRPTHRPISVSTIEYAMRRPRWMLTVEPRGARDRIAWARV